MKYTRSATRRRPFGMSSELVAAFVVLALLYGILFGQIIGDIIRTVAE